MKQILVYIAALVLVAVLAGGCTRTPARYVTALTDADSLAECGRADSVLNMLASMPADSFSKSERALYALLTVKAMDKTYTRHKSDREIREALGYYASHSNGIRYAEALYYAGRVASDMGDAPTALRYFGEAEEEAMKVAPHSELYLNILSQKGLKLADLRLYDEAERYLLKTLQISEDIGDSSNLHYDYHALGELYLSMRRLDDAEPMIGQALKLKPRDELLRCCMAGIKYEQHAIPEALRLIRGVPETIDSVSRHFALAYAADIYREAGILDTAYMYARELAELPGNKNKTTAYHILLGKEMLGWIGTDCIAEYAEAFLKAAEEKYDGNEASAAIIQNSLYNYGQHEAARAQAEENSKRLMILCTLLIVIILCGIIGWLAKLFRDSRRTIRMQRKVLSLEKESEIASDNPETHGKIICTDNSNGDAEVLRAEIIKRVGEQSWEHTASYVVKRTKDEGREMIKEALQSRSPLSEDSVVWGRIEDYVESRWKDFGVKLTALSGNTLTERERRLAFLIRCGATPTELAGLLGRGKSTISLYRNTLCRKLFGKDKNLKELDYIIRSI